MKEKTYAITKTEEINKCPSCRLSGEDKRIELSSISNYRKDRWYTCWRCGCLWYEERKKGRIIETTIWRKKDPNLV
jgi:hypothetical protein